MIPRSQYTTDKPAYEVDQDIFQRFSVLKQAFVTLGQKDTGQTGILYPLEKMFATMGKNIMKNAPGKTHIDYAVNLGANAVNMVLGEYGLPNSHFLKWEPLFIPELLTERPFEADAETLTELVKNTAKVYGSDMVGITGLDKKWVYSQDLLKPFVFKNVAKPAETEDEFIIPDSVTNAIVMGVGMNMDFIDTSPAVLASTAASMGYSRMGILAVSLAEFIRSLGYIAIPCMNDTALSIPLAVDAGLGEIGRHGLLITPEFGSSVRLCKVLTNMPLIPDKPIDMGITDFCNQCFLCAEICPSSAISKGKPTFEGVCENNNPGIKKWYIDAEACLKFWQINGSDCAQCISVCPFTYGYEWSQCVKCERCETTQGCALHVVTFLRQKHGYIKDAHWGSRPVNSPLVRTGL